MTEDKIRRKIHQVIYTGNKEEIADILKRYWEWRRKLKKQIPLTDA